MVKPNKNSIIEVKRELKEAVKWAKFAGYKEKDVQEIIKSVRKKKNKKDL